MKISISTAVMYSRKSLHDRTVNAQLQFLSRKAVSGGADQDTFYVLLAGSVSCPSHFYYSHSMDVVPDVQDFGSVNTVPGVSMSDLGFGKERARVPHQARILATVSTSFGIIHNT
jgi:hypothetical protein